MSQEIIKEFKVIETQEQLDAIVSERVKRAKESVRKEYADFDTYKQAYENQETVKQTYENQIAEMQKQYAETQSTIDGLNTKIAQYEMDSVKTRACVEYGLPLEMASRIHGATEEEIMKDASTLSSFVSTKSAPPLRNPEAKIEDGVTAAFRKLNPNIKF